LESGSEANVPLSEKARLEKKILRFLQFHERSPVGVTGDPETCARFSCPDSASFARLLGDMASRNLLRVLPPPVKASDALNAAGALEGTGARGAPLSRDRLVSALEDGIRVMITSEGKRRYSELRSATSKIRQDDWQEERRPAGPGAWVRADADP